MSKIIGIDLASTASAVACVINGTPEIISNTKGNRTTPSVVYYGKDGEIKVGDDAKKKLIVEPKRTVELIKRFMGASFKETKKYHNLFGYEIVEGPNDTVRVKIDDKLLTPQEISAQILMYMKKCAEDYLGEEVTEAVITVPAYFDDVRRQAVMEASKIAGLDCKRIVNEPTAAALAYGSGKDDLAKVLIISDLGGSTTDFSIIDVADGVFEVVATNGDPMLGGKDIDNTIAKHIVENCQKQFGYDVSKDPQAYTRIVEAAEKAKIELSSTVSTDINLPFLCVVDGVPQHYTETLTRAELDKMISWFIDKIKALADDLIKKSGKNISEIDGVVGVGGSIRVPAIQDYLENYFGKKMDKGVNPDEAIALGAAIQGSILSGEDKNGLVLLDIQPLSLGIATVAGFSELIPAGTTIPFSKKQIYSTAQDNQSSVFIDVLCGGRACVEDNRSIAGFSLDSIMPAPRGVPQIEVSFDIDANGILKVSATDKATGKEQHITVEPKSGLSDDDIERMKKEAEDNAEADKKKAERLHKLNAADSNIYNTEKILKEMNEKLTDDEKTAINEKLESLKMLFNVEGEKDVDAIDGASQALMEEVSKASTRLYSENAQQNGGTEQDNPFANGSFDPSQFTQTETV